MENSLLCTICGEPSARYCGSCRSAAYCSSECQQTDWRPHRPLCRKFKEMLASDFSARPSPSHFLAIYFPMRTWKVKLVWVDTEEIEGEPGYINPKLNELLHIPGNERYIGRGIECVRGNILRGRTENADTLNIWHLDDICVKNLKVNEALHGTIMTPLGDTWGEMMWKGPLVAVLKVGNVLDPKKVRDITLTAYRDAIDYLGYFREGRGSMIDGVGALEHSSNVILEDRIGKVKGVRINCVENPNGDVDQQLVEVNVPKSHPLFNLEGDAPLDIAERVGLWWVYKHYTEKDSTQNPLLRLLLLQGPEEDAKRGGSVVVVDRGKRDLSVASVRAVCRMVQQTVMPQIVVDGNNGEATKAKILETITPKSLEPFL